VRWGFLSREAAKVDSPDRRTCSAFGGSEIESDPRAEVLDEILLALAAGGGEAGEDLPCSLATLGFVAARELASDHGRSQ